MSDLATEVDIQAARLCDPLGDCDSVLIITTFEPAGYGGEFIAWKQAGCKPAALGLLEEWLLGAVHIPPVNPGNEDRKITDTVNALIAAGAQSILVMMNVLSDKGVTYAWIRLWGNLFTIKTTGRMVVRALMYGTPLYGCGDDA